jgi:GT2 family glycosyltransferase
MAPVENVVAIVVTYNPKIPRLQTALDALGQQVLHLFIVDNGSKNLNEVRALVANVTSRSLIEMGSNQGIGAALNRGVSVALAHAPRWFLTMDQDSVVQEGAIASILEEWQLLPCPDTSTNSNFDCSFVTNKQSSLPWSTMASFFQTFHLCEV